MSHITTVIPLCFLRPDKDNSNLFSAQREKEVRAQRDQVLPLPVFPRSRALREQRREPGRAAMLPASRHGAAPGERRESRPRETRHNAKAQTLPV